MEPIRTASGRGLRWHPNPLVGRMRRAIGNRSVYPGSSRSRCPVSGTQSALVGDRLRIRSVSFHVSVTYAMLRVVRIPVIRIRIARVLRSLRSFTLMASPSADDVIQAFVAVVRDQLTNGDSLHVPGLGTFSVEHRASEMKESEDGPDRMLPPRDVVRFDPDE